MVTQNIPPKPTKPCPCCKKGNEWWLRTAHGKAEWLCQLCHPNPNPDKKGE